MELKVGYCTEEDILRPDFYNVVLELCRAHSELEILHIIRIPPKQLETLQMWIYIRQEETLMFMTYTNTGIRNGRYCAQTVFFLQLLTLLVSSPLSSPPKGLPKPLKILIGLLEDFQ